MDIYAQIAQTLKGITGGSKAFIFPAQVKSTKDSTCTIAIGELELTDVRLRAVINDKRDKILITPKQGSYVLVADLSDGNYRDLAVMAYSEVEKIEIKVGTVEFAIKDGKVGINNGQQNLCSLLSELIDAVTAITVPTSQGTSGTPNNSAQFATIKTKLKQLME